MGLTASMFGMGATLSNYLGQNIVEQFGHVTSLTGSLIISVIPIAIFGFFMPETLGDRDRNNTSSTDASSVAAATEKPEKITAQYVQMS